MLQKRMHLSVLSNASHGRKNKYPTLQSDLQRQSKNEAGDIELSESKRNVPLVLPVPFILALPLSQSITNTGHFLSAC